MLKKAFSLRHSQHKQNQILAHLHWPQKETYAHIHINTFVRTEIYSQDYIIFLIFQRSPFLFHCQYCYETGASQSSLSSFGRVHRHFCLPPCNLFLTDVMLQTYFL